MPSKISKRQAGVKFGSALMTLNKKVSSSGRMIPTLLTRTGTVVSLIMLAQESTVPRFIQAECGTIWAAELHGKDCA